MCFISTHKEMDYIYRPRTVNLDIILPLRRTATATITDPITLVNQHAHVRLVRRWIWATTIVDVIWALVVLAWMGIFQEVNRENEKIPRPCPGDEKLTCFALATLISHLVLLILAIPLLIALFIQNDLFRGFLIRAYLRGSCILVGIITLGFASLITPAGRINMYKKDQWLGIMIDLITIMWKLPTTMIALEFLEAENDQ